MESKLAGDEVVVLAEFNEEDTSGIWDDGRQVLVTFEDWGSVALLDGLAQRVMAVTAAGNMARVRILGTSLDIELSGVRAWYVEASWGEDGQSLGDGMLLPGHAAAKVRKVEEWERPILEVRDDGMLLVKHEAGWATIDLAALAEIQPSAQR